MHHSGCWWWRRRWTAGWPKPHGNTPRLGPQLQQGRSFRLVGAGQHTAGVPIAFHLLHPQVPLPRGAWDDSAGYVALTKYATAEARERLEAGMLQAAPSGYLAHAAAGALLRWVLGDRWARLRLVAPCSAFRRPCRVMAGRHVHGSRAGTRVPLPAPRTACAGAALCVWPLPSVEAWIFMAHCTQVP